MLGFGLVANSFCIILCSLVAFLVSKFIFLRKEEKILAEKYGISAERVRQLEKNAMKKLRQYMEAVV